MTDREIIDEVTLLLRKARESEDGFVLDHHDYMAMHCLLNIEVGADVAKEQSE